MLVEQFSLPLRKSLAIAEKLLVIDVAREGRLVLFKDVAPKRLYGSVDSLITIHLKERQSYVNLVGSKIQKRMGGKRVQRSYRKILRQ